MIFIFEREIRILIYLHEFILFVFKKYLLFTSINGLTFSNYNYLGQDCQKIPAEFLNINSTSLIHHFLSLTNLLIYSINLHNSFILVSLKVN